MQHEGTPLPKREKTVGDYDGHEINSVSFVEVVDCPMNRSNNFWRLLIGWKGRVLRVGGDELVDVVLYSPDGACHTPAEGLLPERLRVIGSLPSEYA